MLDTRATRYRCDLQARLEFGAHALDVRILDLSETGAFIATEEDIQVDDRGRLGIPLPGGGDPVWADVTVVRLGKSQLEIRHPRVDNVTVTRLGVGLRFESVPEDEIERLRGFLEILD